MFDPNYLRLPHDLEVKRLAEAIELARKDVGKARKVLSRKILTLETLSRAALDALGANGTESPADPPNESAPPADPLT